MSNTHLKKQGITDFKGRGSFKGESFDTKVPAERPNAAVVTLWPNRIV